MRGLRRHPSRRQLETWFDGEAPEHLAWHLAGCTACFRHVDKLARIRTAVQGLASPASGVPVRALAPRRPSARMRVLVAVPVAVLLAAGLVAGVDRAGLHGSLSAARGHAARSTGPDASDHGDHGVPGTADGPGATAGGTDAATGAPATAAGRPAGAAGPGTGPGSSALTGLRLAVIVPTAGAQAADGAEVAKAVQQAVAEADGSGGVRGGPVTVTVVPAGDSAAIAALGGKVDAVVGGFGAAVPVATPWVLPADPWAAGPDVVATELSPMAAGARLGQDLLQRSEIGTVGVVEGTGPDADLAAGLASEVPVSVVQAPASGACLPAVTSLEQQQVVAVAVAGSPSLAASCLAAFGASAWAPPGGVLLAPSAAYAGVAPTGLGGAHGVYTALGLPWPESSSPGATRFRAALPGVTSYRALVSYAAVELAVDVARTTGSLSPGAMAGHTWRNDLYDFAGADNAGVQVVEDSAQGWVSAP